MSWRDCFRLQRVPPWGAFQLTAFGRAIVDTGNLGEAGLDAPDRYYRLYWVRLPIWQMRHRFYTDNYGMQQAVLMLHGRDGFRIVWRDAR